MRKIYAIGVGGSGAKCVEAAIFLHSLGLYGENSELRILLVDADTSNGNSQRTGVNFRTADDAQKAFGQGKSPLMDGQFFHYGTWNPLGDQIHNTNLAAVFNKQALRASAPPLAKLFDALYSPAEQEADLGVGFRGRPPIGSAVMSRLELDSLQQTQAGGWQQLFNNLTTDLGVGKSGDVVVHFFGSIFGGTGASGVPTLAKLVSNQLRQDNLRVRIHASLLLPYFAFERPDDGDQTVFAETRFFALNTQAALQYLTEQSEGCFDSVYLIGDNAQTRYDSHTGGKNQENGAHFVELYAALAANHGFDQPMGETVAHYISRADVNSLIWTDLPDDEIAKLALSKGVRFAYAWFYNFSLELEAARKLGGKKFAKGAPWFQHFFALRAGEGDKPLVEDAQEMAKNDLLTAWARKFLQWAQQVSSAHVNGEQLFQLKHLDDLNQSPGYREHLHQLIIDKERSQAAQNGDRLDTIKNRLADEGKSYDNGVFGLAHALFALL
ncbi:hypothetical protein [Synechocystis salina]|uniref:Uncharacterized protein n=1 Tax=Synechocystis salina LEGE 00031 TaxID=1828736 RepID=A0ABR9VTY1_9SYNC|nr:hypothetical protein [Synechocystis salina]MBE9241518.1 hypothetical protein [Synechocystis salina LEGE 00041]MBE9254810.1 hypothetical protein [Synechocystis salina LEGE 00031]